jgi:WD40 repeat protein
MRSVRVWGANTANELLALRGGSQSYGAAAWSPDGKSIVAGADDSTVWVWSDLDPPRGVDDSRLWTATTYCMPKERRMELLDVSEGTAQAQLETCVRRVQQAEQARIVAP